MKKQFVYLFPMGCGIAHSFDTEKVLVERGDNDEDRAEISQFIKVAKVADFISLSTGEMIFRTQ